MNRNKLIAAFVCVRVSTAIDALVRLRPRAIAYCLLLATSFSIQAPREALGDSGPIDISPPSPKVLRGSLPSKALPRPGPIDLSSPDAEIPKDSLPSQATVPVGPIDGSPEQNTDVSTRIATGCGYDAYTGSIRRTVTDLTVPGAIGSRGLSIVRSYSSLSPWESGWSFSHDWRIEGRPSSGDGYLVYFPDGRISKFKPPRSSQTGETALRGPAGTNERLFLQSTNQYIGTADLWLEDGSRVHFDRETELSSNDQYVIDYFTLRYLVDPHGQTTTFSYEQIPGTFDLHDIRLSRITDASGRFLSFTYGSVIQVTASNGQWVRYTVTAWNSPIGGQLSRVDYSDGTFATYTYDRVPVIGSDGGPGTLPRLVTAQDTRAEGPMRAIQYEYTPSPQKDFSGELKAERHFGDGTLVSAFAHNSDRTSSTDTRGDGPSRTFNMQLVRDVPLVTSKSDFYGRLEYYYYDANNYLRQVTDRRGYPTIYVNEPILGRPKLITYPDPHHSTVRYEYSDPDNPYFIASRTDENLKTTSYARNAVTHQIERIDYPDGGWEEFAYNGFGQVTTHRRTNGVYDAYDHFAYDTTGRLTKRWNPTPSPDYPPLDALPHFSFTYYTSADIWQWEDRVRSVTDPKGQVTIYEYDRGSDGSQVAGRGLVTKISYPDDTHDGAFPNGTSQSFGYDAYGNRTSVSDELQHTTLYEYDDYNRVTKVTNPMNQATITSYALDWVNPFLHTTHSIKYVVSPMNKNIVFDYDANLRKKDQIAALETADVTWTFFDYDEVGNLITTTDPRGKVTSYGYDTRNRQTSVKNNELNETTILEYDDVGNKKKEIRPDTTFRTWDYDAMNRLWHAYDWRLSDPATANQTTTYGHDIAGNLRTITDTKGAVYGYNYDLMNRKISQTYPADATGVIRNNSYHYDDAGNVDYLKNPAGQYKHIAYDSRNRAYHSWWDNDAGPDVMTSYDDAGRVTSIRTMNGATAITTVGFGYDDANRKRWEEQTVAGFPTSRLETDYDFDGDRVYLHFPGWYMMRYDYTQRHQLAHIYDGNGTPIVNFTYDTAGNVTKRQNVAVGVNDSTNIPSSQYDPLNRPLQWENTGGGDNAFARSWYQYDNVGREVATWRDEQGSKGERFSYNPLGQVTGVNYNADQVWTGNPQNATRNVTYTMTPDALNRQSMSENGTVTGYTPNGMNQYTNVGGNPLSYDGNFNQTGYGLQSTSFNAASQLTSLVNPGSGNSAAFTYDGLGRCLKRVINGAATLIAYDGWKPTVEWDGAGSLQAWNIYGAGADEILWRYQGNYGYLRYHHDVHGNVAFLLGLWGEGLEKYTYDAFGQPTITDWNGNARSQSAYGNRFMFTGREYFAELGLYDYRHRFYHPGLGRFLQTDPLGFDAGDMNLFRYCADDPVDKTDPTGLWGWSVMSPPIASPYGYEMDKWIRIREQQSQIVGWRPEIIRYGREYVYTKDKNTLTGEYDQLLAHTYNTLRVEAKANADGSVKRAIIVPRTVVEFAVSAGPHSQAFALERETEHERPIRWWAGSLGRAIAERVASEQIRIHARADAAALAIDRALRPSFEKADRSTKSLDWTPAGLGGHQSPYRYDQ
jgi:RHS repeat-associated protein